MLLKAGSGQGSVYRREPRSDGETRRESSSGEILSEVPADGTSGSVIRILLIDPRPLPAAAVQYFLESAGSRDDASRFEVTTVSVPGDSPPDRHFDLLLVHVSPAADVFSEVERCLCAIPTVHRKVPPVVFSDSWSAGDVAAAVRGGAPGYLPSTLDSGKIVAALGLLAAGLAVVPRAGLTYVYGGSGVSTIGETAQPPQAGPFTARERDVLQRLHDGKPNKCIARELGLSQSTVKVHVRSVFRKLGVQNRTEAALAAAQVLLGHGGSA